MDFKKIVFGIFTIFLLASCMQAYSRNFLDDKYEYTSEGLFLTSSELGGTRFYGRRQVERRGIDVSTWQGYIDWERVRESGVEFAMIREGFGRKCPRQVDKWFHTNINNAHRSGIPCGIYHFSYAQNPDEAAQEADFCLENIRGYKLEYPVAFDIEYNKRKALGRRVLTDICKAFCQKMRQNGYYVTIYTNPDWIRNFLNKGELFYGYDLWLAQYRSLRTTFECGIWQYTSLGEIEGVGSKKHTDLDLCWFDYPLIVKEAHLNGF